MAKQPSKNLNLTVNAIAIEDDLSGAELSMENETPVVTSLADSGPRRVEGNYDYRMSMDLFPDFATAQSDATIFAAIGSGGRATTFDPTGATAGANDPNYDSTSMMLSRYSIRARVGEPITGTAEMVGNAALSRAVA